MSAEQKDAGSATTCNQKAKTFFVWNHRHHQLAPVINTENFTNFGLMYEKDSVGFSSLPRVVPINEEDDEPEELISSAIKAKESVYNIVQNKMNLREERGPKFLCQECRYSMHTRLSMITHMKMHLKPFCEVCFSSFESNDSVRRHINSAHPEVISRDCTPPPSKDYYSLQTIAPPNTPTNPISDDEMKTIEDLVNPIVKFPINAVAVSKLLNQQDTDGGISTEDEQRLVIDAHPRPGGSRGRPKKKSPVVKRQLKKKQSKTKIQDLTKPDSILKKITSRFGRAISLKIPQYY